MRRWLERSNDTERLPLRPFCRDCIIAMRGYDFRKGQHQEIRCADIDREELIEILDRNFLDCRSFRDPCIGDKDVQAISDDAACLLGKLVGAIRGGKVRRYGVRTATGFAYLRNNTVGFLCATAVMHENT